MCKAGVSWSNKTRSLQLIFDWFRPTRHARLTFRDRTHLHFSWRQVVGFTSSERPCRATLRGKVYPPWNVNIKNKKNKNFKSKNFYFLFFNHSLQSVTNAVFLTWLRTIIQIVLESDQKVTQRWKDTYYKPLQRFYRIRYSLFQLSRFYQLSQTYRKRVVYT